MPIRNMIHIPVKATDTAIKIDKLLGRNNTFVKSCQTILNACIVQWPLSNRCTGHSVINVYGMIVYGSSHSIGIAGTVTLELQCRDTHFSTLLFHRCIETINRIKSCCAARKIRDGCPGSITRHGLLLLKGK